MTTVAPLRRSLRIAEVERRREQEKKDQFKMKFKNQIAALKAILSKLGDIINRSDFRRATWRKAEQLTQVCENHCLDLWLHYETDDPVIKAASNAFVSLYNPICTMYTLSHYAYFSDNHHKQIVDTYNKFIVGVDTIESTLVEASCPHTTC